MALGPDDADEVQFAKPPLGKRGYDAEQVDGFVDRVKATLRGEDTLTPEAAEQVTFGKPARGGRGYDEDEVDTFLELVQLELAELAETGGVQQAAVQQEPTAHAEQPPPGGPVVAESLYERKPWWRFGR